MQTTLNRIFLVISSILLFSNYCQAEPPLPPDQPSTGPGGSEYRHQEVAHNGPYWVRDIKPNTRNESYKYFIFTPAAPMAEVAPVVLFLHGWGAVTATTYQAWIEHIVKKGYIVVWAQYQPNTLHDNPLRTSPWLYPRRIIAMWKDALQRLDEAGSLTHPARDERGMIQTAIIGHSAGAYLAVAIAAKTTWEWKNLPIPHAVVAVEPGALGFFVEGPFHKLDPSTKVILIVGDDDDVICKSSAQRLWRGIPQIPDENKEFLLVRSDFHGQPEQIANHYFPATSGARDTAAVDARDFYVTFKLSVGSLNCAFRDTDCEIAFGNGNEEQVYMGEWSDGQLITPMVWVQDPESLDTTCQDPGLRGILE